MAPKIQDSIAVLSSSKDPSSQASLHVALAFYSHNQLLLQPTNLTMSILAVLIVTAFAAANAQPPIQIGDRPFSLIPFVVS